MPAVKKAYTLYDLELDRVDLVRAGSNPHADIVLFKSAKEEDVPAPKKKVAPKTKAAPKKPADSRTKSKQRGDEADDDDEDEDVVKNEDDDDEDDDADEEDVEKDGDEDEEDDDEESDDSDDEDDEDGDVEKSRGKDKGKDKGKGKGKKPAPKKPAKKAAAADDDDEDDDADDDGEVDESIMKSLPLAVRKKLARQGARLEKAEQIAQEALDRADEERDRRETTESIEKAKSELPAMPGTDEEKGSVLRALATRTLTKDVVKSIRKMLKAGNAALRDMLMSETGRRREVDEDDGSAQAELMTKARALQNKNPEMDIKKARYEVLQADGELYKRVRQESKSSVN